MNNFDDNVVVHTEDIKEKGNNKKCIFLVILGLLILVVGCFLTLLLLHKDEEKKTIEKVEKTLFKEETYFTYDDAETGYFGYVIFEADGKYNKSYVFDGKVGSAGKYYIEGDKIVLTSDYSTGTGSPYEDNTKVEIKYSNNKTLTIDGNKYNKISKENFDNWHADRHGLDIIKYDDVVNEYNQGIEENANYERLTKVNDLIAMLDDPNTTVSMVTCGNCSTLDETTIDNLSCNNGVNLRKSSIAKLKEKLTTYNKTQNFTYGALCSQYKLVITLGDKTYALDFIDSNDLILTEKGLWADGDTSYQYVLEFDGLDIETYGSDMISFFKTLR